MPLRRTLAVIATALLLVVGLGSATPTTAGPKNGPVPWGWTKSGNHTLKPGCHRYAYRYRIKAPTRSWMAEIQLLNRKGVRIASDALFSESDPARGRRNWSTEICRNSTVPGKHVIRMRVTYAVDPDHSMFTTRSGFVKNTRFRMRRR